jgi:hypothetical protein
LGIAQNASWQGQWLLHESAWFTQDTFCLDSLPKKEGAYLLLSFEKNRYLRLFIPESSAICESPAVPIATGNWWIEDNTLMVYVKGRWSDGHSFEYKIRYAWDVIPGERCLKVLQILHLSE